MQPVTARVAPGENREPPIGDADEAARLRHYRYVRRQMNVIAFGANALGAILITVYFNLADSGEAATEIGSLDVLILVAVLAGVMLLGGAISSWLTRPMTDWHHRAYTTLPAELEPPSLRIRQMALNNPLISAGVSLAMWLVATLLFGTLASVDLGTSPVRVDWGSLAEIVLGGGGLSGLVAATLIYFAVERLWRNEIPLFFADSSLQETPAFRLTVRRRLLILLGMSTIPLFLAAAVGYGHAADVPDPALRAAMLPNLARLELYIVGMGLLVSIGLAVTLGRSLAEPLETFSRKMAAVEEGHLEERMAVTSNDELGVLAEGFNAMVEGLGREEVIRRLFGHYVTPQVAEHAIEQAAALPRTTGAPSLLDGADAAALGEATVLFTDIRGFTALTEQMGPEALIRLLNRYFRIASAIITEQGGLVARLGGDSLLVIFGSPLNPSEDHAERGVRAAWGLLPALAAFNQSQVRRGEPRLRIGVGLATGLVLAGNVGSEERLEYTVLGDAVNLASRLEAMTKELQVPILLDETTAQAVATWAPLRPVGQVEVRGQSAPVQVFALSE
jgi:adenylate cyclase